MPSVLLSYATSHNLKKAHASYISSFRSLQFVLVHFGVRTSTRHQPCAVQRAHANQRERCLVKLIIRSPLGPVLGSRRIPVVPANASSTLPCALPGARAVR
jgi:hypothetical protein